VSNDFQLRSRHGQQRQRRPVGVAPDQAVTKQNLAGSKIVGRWKDSRTNTVYSIAELDFRSGQDHARGPPTA